MSRCPRCGDEVGADGCRCGQCAGDGDRKLPPPVPGGKDPQWYFKGYVVLIALLKAGPLALPLVWCHPRLRLWGKLLVTVASVVYAWGVVWAILWMWDQLMAQLDALRAVW